MRTFLTGLILVTGLGVLAAPAAAQDLRFAYVDSRRIMEEAPAAQEARRTWQQDLARYRSEIERLETELERMFADYQQQQAMLTPENRRQREEQIRQRQQALQQRVSQLDEEAAGRQQELLEPVMARINEIIDEIRRQGGYTFIFDAAAGSIVAADPRLDITDQVLSRLQATAGR